MLTETEINILKDLRTAHENKSIRHYHAVDMAGLLNSNFVEGNPNLVNADGIAFRIRAEGLAALQNEEARLANPEPELPLSPWNEPVISVPAPAPPVVEQPAPIVPPTPVIVPDAPLLPPAIPAETVVNSFVVGSGFPAPVKKSKRKSAGRKEYPFESLPLNGYIFVANTPERKDQKRALASTISSANKRFAKNTPPLYFQVFRATKDQVFGQIVAPADGAYIVRLEPPTTPASPQN